MPHCAMATDKEEDKAALWKNLFFCSFFLQNIKESTREQRVDDHLVLRKEGINNPSDPFFVYFSFWRNK